MFDLAFEFEVGFIDTIWTKVLPLSDVGSDYPGTIIQDGKDYVLTGIPGLDKLFSNGIPKGSSILVAGGAGVGKTTLCLQILLNAVENNETCYYMGFKESNEE